MMQEVLKITLDEAKSAGIPLVGFCGACKKHKPNDWHVLSIGLCDSCHDKNLCSRCNKDKGRTTDYLCKKCRRDWQKMLKEVGSFLKSKGLM